MTDLVSRANMAIRLSPSDTAGIIRCAMVPRPDVGSQPRWTEKRSISMIPSQKCGMERPNSAPSMLPMSSMEPLRTAEIIPMGTARTRANTMAATASSKLAGSRSMTSSITGTW